MGGPRPVIDRLLAKVAVNAASGCWDWTASRDKKGYGRLKVGVVMRLAHRVAYEILVGPIPDGLALDHLCRNRGCVNPAHMEPVTAAENTRRGLSKALRVPKRECPAGHPYDEANTLVDSRGYRHCRTCMRERARAAYHANLDASRARNRENYWADPQRHRDRRNQNRQKKESMP